ncbi:MAG: DUF2894 domain-containing protein [Azonexus sp.]
MADPGETGDPDEMAAMANHSPELDALRASGVAARDPVRFAYLAALARRAAAQPPAIRLSLNARISAAASELAARPTPATSEISKKSTVSPLAELLAYISQHAHEPPAATPEGNFSPRPRSLQGAANRHLEQESKNASAGRSGQGPELKSVAYFRNEWSKLSSEQQLTQTLAQAPENAGPMNSQHLVLRSLERMRDIAPDYLQGFMSYIDTLIWLEHADPTKPGAGRAGGEGEKKTRTTKRGATNR